MDAFKKSVFCFAALIFGSTVSAQAPLAPAVPEYDNEWAVSVGHDSLDDGSPDWQEFAITRSGVAELGNVVFGTLRRTERFGQSDTQIEVGTSGPLGEAWQITLGGSIAPSHNILPKNSLMIELAREFPGGWILHGGFRTSQFTEDKVTIASFIIEREWERIHASYTLARSRLSKEQNNSHALALAYKYGNRSRLGLIYVTGAEAIRVNVGRVVSSDIKSIALNGVHWYQPQWGLTYTIGQFEQGEFYTRDGLQLGLAYRF